MIGLLLLLPAVNSSVTGFSVFKKTNQDYSTGDTITFDGKLFDEGDHYNFLLNQFTCEKNGIYYISINLKRKGESLMRIDVVKNSLTILRSDDIRLENAGTTHSNSGIVRCFSGENISVKAFGAGSVAGDVINIWTTFTVFMVYEY